MVDNHKNEEKEEISIEINEGDNQSRDLGDKDTRENIESKESGEAQEEIDNYYDQWLRLKAEFQNYRRRQESKIQQWKEHVESRVVDQFLPVVDDFDILFKHHPLPHEQIDINGVKMIYNKMITILKDMGLEQVETETFDPNVHEAVMAEESDQVKEGDILNVWQRGYTFKDKLVRPAKVIIAKQKSGETDGE